LTHILLLQLYSDRLVAISHVLPVLQRYSEHVGCNFFDSDDVSKRIPHKQDSDGANSFCECEACIVERCLTPLLELTKINHLRALIGNERLPKGTKGDRSSDFSRFSDSESDNEDAGGSVRELGEEELLQQPRLFVLRWLYQQKPSVGTLYAVAVASSPHPHNLDQTFATFTDMSWLVRPLVDRSVLQLEAEEKTDHEPLSFDPFVGTFEPAKYSSWKQKLESTEFKIDAAEDLTETQPGTAVGENCGQLSALFRVTYINIAVGSPVPPSLRHQLELGDRPMQVAKAFEEGTLFRHMIQRKKTDGGGPFQQRLKHAAIPGVQMLKLQVVTQLVCLATSTPDSWLHCILHDPEHLGKQYIPAMVEGESDFLAKALKQQFPDGRMCGRCNFGPIVKSECDNLESHHQKADDYRVRALRAEGKKGNLAANNACPKCEWFVPHWSQWPKWDGKLDAGVGTSTGYPAGLNAETCEHPVRRDGAGVSGAAKTVPPLVTRLLRFMLHSLLATSCVVFNKHTEIDNLMKCEEAGGGCKKATEMMAADWNAIKDLTNLSDELLASFVHIVLHEFFRMHLDSPTICKPMTSTEGRIHFENEFIKRVQPFLSDQRGKATKELDRWMNLELKGKNELKENHERKMFSAALAYDEIVQQQSEVENAYSMLWFPFEAVSLNKLRQQFSLDEQNEREFPVLFCFLDQSAASHLSAVSHLPAILEWHKLLRETYPDGTLSLEEAKKKMNKDVIEDNGNTEHNQSKSKAQRRKEIMRCQRVMGQYMESFNSVFPLVERFECQPNPHCKTFKMELDSPLDFSLPFGQQNGEGEFSNGIFTVATCQHLASLHNTLLRRAEVAEAVEVKFSDSIALNRRNVIDYKESRDLFPLLRTFSARSQRGGDERRKYDLEEIDSALRRNLLQGKAPIKSQGDEGNVPDFKFRVDSVITTKDFTEPVDDLDMKQISRELHTQQERVLKLAEVLRDGLNYLLSLELDSEASASMKLDVFMCRMWEGDDERKLAWEEEIAPTTLRDKIKVSQLGSLLEGLLKSAGAETDPLQMLQQKTGWEEELPPQSKSAMVEFEQAVRRENAAQPRLLGETLLPVMRSFMLEHAADVNQAQPLGVFLQYVEAPSGEYLSEELVWFADAFPAVLPVRECLAAYRVLDKLQEELEPSADVAFAREDGGEEEGGAEQGGADGPYGNDDSDSENEDSNEGGREDLVDAKGKEAEETDEKRRESRKNDDAEDNIFDAEAKEEEEEEEEQQEEQEEQEAK
jgi:hypothetical protein